MQKRQLNVKLAADEMDEMEGLAASCEITATALGGFFIRAALRAVDRRGAKLTVPLDFQIVELPANSGPDALATEIVGKALAGKKGKSVQSP